MSRSQDYHQDFTFLNGRGATVICYSGPLSESYGGHSGLFEVHVKDASGQHDYTTPITGDILGHCDFATVAKALADIAALPPG